MQRRLALVLLFGLSLVVESRQSDFVFSLADLTVVQHSPGREFQLEAFRAFQNDRILSGNITSSMRQLSWVSLGDPQLVTATGNDNKTRIVQLKTNSIEVRVTLLKDSMRELLAQAAQEKHAVPVSPQQILTVPLTHVRCTLPLEADDGTRLVLTGKAANLQENPLQIAFDAPRSSVERAILEHTLRQAGSDQQAHLSIHCTFSALSKLKRVNTLTISVNQMHQFGIEEKLFGPAEERFVSRKQMAALAAELYSRLDIVAEYEMPQHEFSESFIRDFIQQAAVQDFGQVALHDALRAMSQYAIPFGDDLKADEVVRDMGKVFRIDQVGDKSHIVVNTDKSTEGRQRNHAQGSSSSRHKQESDRRTDSEKQHQNAGSDSASSSVGGSVSAGFGGFSAGASYSQSDSSGSTYDRSKYNHDGRSFYDMFNVADAQSFVADTSHRWLDSSTSLDDQLRDLNVHTRNDVEWAIEGRKVIPKKVNVARLSRSQFSKSLHFSRVRKDVVEAAFSKEFTFQTDAFEEPVQMVEYFIQNVAALARENTALKLDLNRLKGVVEAHEERTSVLQQKVKTLEQGAVTADEQLRALRGSHANLSLAMSKQGQTHVSEMTKQQRSFVSEMRRELGSCQSSVLNATKSVQQSLRTELSKVAHKAQSDVTRLSVALRDSVAVLRREIVAATPHQPQVKCRPLFAPYESIFDVTKLKCGDNELLQRIEVKFKSLDEPYLWQFAYLCCAVSLQFGTTIPD